MKGLTRLKEEIHNKILCYRSIENIVASVRFARLWDDSSEHEQEVILTLVSTGNRDGVIKWVRNHPSIDLGEKGIKQLRDIAKRAGVKYYATLSHLELVTEILRKEKGND